MVVVCCVPFCKNNGKTPNVSFHNFTKDPKLMEIWIHKIKRDTHKSKRNPKPFHVSKYTKICSAHFRRENFLIKSEKNRLKADAVPSLFPWNSAEVRKESNHFKVVAEAKRANQRSEETSHTVQSNDGPGTVKQEQINYYQVMVDHKCDRCPYISKSVLYMEIHKRRHQSQLELFDCEKSDLENFSCENCDFTTQSITSFTQHSNCNVKREVIIIDDKEAFTKLVYNSHGIKLYRRIYRNVHKCKKCPYSTRSIFFLLNHVTRHQHRRTEFNCQNSNLEEYFCEQCQFSTNNTIHFREHIKDCLGELRQETYKQTVEGSIKWFECQQCVYKTKWRSAMKSHITNKHTPKNSIKWFECHQCEHKTKWRTDLERHIASKHTPEHLIKRFECQQCEYKTMRRSDLKKHITWKHTPEDSIEWFECQQCEYKSKKAVNLKSHISIKHTPESSIKWFECPQCEFKTTQRNYLKNHIHYKHTPEDSIKWFECYQCEYKTKWRGNLKEHVIKKHIYEGSMKCQQCEFTTSQCCHKPERTIKWFECQQCEFKTKKRSSLKNHINNKHTSEDSIKWFECQQCEFKTKHPGYLEKHIAKLHEPESAIKWLECQQCEFKTKWRTNLKLHITNKHTPKDCMEWLHCEQCDYRTKVRRYLTRHCTKKHLKVKIST